MQNAHEFILASLFSLLTSSVQISFTGNGTGASPTITNLSSTKGFFTGLPVFGPGVPRNSYIVSFDPVGLTVTLSNALTASSTAGSFATGFQTTGRRLKLWSEVQAFPALFLRHVSDEDSYPGPSVMQKTTLHCEIWMYSQAGQNPDAIPDTTLNNLVTAVRTALANDGRGYPQTLAAYNGNVPLVQWVRVHGESNFDPVDLDDISKALIRVQILCP